MKYYSAFKLLSPYKELCILDAASNGVKNKHIEVLTQSFTEKIQLDVVSAEADRFLWEISRKDKESYQSLLLLRCRVSHPIYEKVNLLFNQFQAKYELSLQEMLSCVLDDNGEIFLRFLKKAANGKGEILRRPFNWETLIEFSNREIKPFGADIIYNFDPDLSSLSTWSKNKVQANSELKSYLKSCGLLMISPWALIADSTPRRVKEAWERCGDGCLQLKDVISLHNSYLSQYKQAKETHKRNTGKISGWIPDTVFLSSLSPPQNDRNALIAIDKAIRQYLLGTNYIRQFKEGEESQIASPSINDNEDLNKELIRSILESLKRVGIPIVENVIASDRSRWGKDPSRKLAWELYGQGLSQRDIGARCNHKQAWVSRLIEEKHLSERIAQEAAVELIRRPEFQPLRKDPEGIDRMIEQLRNYLVSSEQEGTVPPLRQIIHTTLS